jgi:ferredoxin-NADP reductase
MPTVTIERIREIGPSTLAITLEAPDQFEAYPGQFVLLRAEVDGEEVSSYYTLSSPEVDDRFEITVAVDEESGTLGPWLAERTTGDTVDIDGPFGDVYYEGEDDVTVLAGGPGIGPAVAIGERAAAAGRNATILYQADEPVHEDRLSSLRDANMTVELLADGAPLPEALAPVEIRGSVYVFGFAEFVTDARDALEATGIDSDDIHVESFGPA